MKKLKSIGIGIIIGMFIVNLIYTVLSVFMKDLLDINLLYAMNCSVILTVICSCLIFRPEASPKKKWIRRGTIIFCGCVISPLFLGLFGCVEFEMLWYSACVGAGAQIWFCCLAFFVVDKIEKKHLARINEKLCEKSFFKSFEKRAQLIRTTEIYTEHSFEYDNVKYTVLKVLKKASKHTVIRLEDENILWEQFYPLGNHPAKDEWVVAKKSFPEKGTVGMIVINGTPLRICGLDENGYVSVNKKVKTERDVYVLTCEELKAFEP